MRTTLDIADDILAAAKELAQRQRKTTGAVISELARAGLTAPLTTRRGKPRSIHGFRPFPSRGGIVTNELIDRLRAGDAY